jgi:L-lactate dehydrogenase (cytochrome)
MNDAVRICQTSSTAGGDLPRMRRGSNGAPFAWHLGNLEAAARRRLPRSIFDYLEGGSYAEITCRANRTDLAALRLRQRVLTDDSPRNLHTSIVGMAARMPVALGPVGFQGLIRRNGEIHAARAAEAFGVPFCLSTFSICSIETLAASLREPFMFQLYLFKDTGVNGALIERAAEARCSALFLTLDTPLQARRNRDCDNGLVVPLKVRPRHVLEMLVKCGWTLDWLLSERTLGNLAAFVPDSTKLADCSSWVENNFKGNVTPADFAWVRERWPGKLVAKGVMDPHDAKLALNLGADAIVVSNHGGRQLDCAESTVRAFPAIRACVGEQVELLFDSGVRSGLDVLKTLGLGANACLVGRAPLYGLAAYGEKGVAATLDLIEQELDAAMRLTGVGSAAQVPTDILSGISADR